MVLTALFCKKAEGRQSHLILLGYSLGLPIEIINPENGKWIAVDRHGIPVAAESAEA